MRVTKQQSWYLNQMGINTYVLRSHSKSCLDEHDEVSKDFLLPKELELSPKTSINVEVGIEQVNEKWETLEKEVDTCIACQLHQTRKNVVFGTGNKQAECVIIGEAPGAEEDIQGEPFVGRAGKLLTNMLYAIGLKRENVYIANILKCRPPNNRDPLIEEVVKCESYLQQQLALIQPKIIVALGRIAAHNLLKTDRSLAQLRGSINHYGAQNTPLVVTYHPAYLLRSPKEKKKAWQDWCFVQSVLRNEY